MIRNIPLAAIALSAIALAGCGYGRHSSAGFRLPADGNAERGKAAFLAFGCHTCHIVPGSDLPRPTVQPPAPVVLGGTVERPISDGYLVTSIVNPGYRAGAGKMPRMPHFADRMTVRQLTDLVEFLQAQYTVQPMPPVYPN